MTRLILDVDTGIDDALALAYLATFDTVDVLGVIGTYGNVSVDTAVRNTSYVLERLGLRHIPVIRGSSHPSWARCFIPDAGCAQFHGTDGLDWEDSARLAIVRLRILLFQIFFRIIPVLILFFLVIIVV